jgi:serine/threonine protein phosphatase PrpC
VLDATEIHAAATDAATASAAAQRLVDTALDRGTKDNTTAAVVRHVADSPDSPDSPDPTGSPE